MSVSDFLFEGRPPPSVTTYGQTVENMPKWLSDYTQGLISRANAVAAEPYQAYGGPRIAGHSGDELDAFQATRDMQGAWRPGIDAAANNLQGGLSQAQSYLQSGTGSFGTFPGAVGDYMDPYIDNVLDRNKSLAMRTLNEDFIPQLQGAFTRAGHFGSDRMMDLGVRGTRDIAEGLNEQNLAALSGAYGQAADIFGRDADRFGQDRTRDLQAAGVSGDLAMQGSQQMGALAEAGQRMGLTDAAALQTVGQAERGMDQASLDLAYKDFLEQRNYPRDTIDWMSTVVRGMPHDSATSTQQHGPADVYQPSGASQLGSLLTAGAGIYDVLKNKAEGGLIRGPLSRRYDHVS